MKNETMTLEVIENAATRRCSKASGFYVVVVSRKTSTEDTTFALAVKIEKFDFPAVIETAKNIPFWQVKEYMQDLVVAGRLCRKHNLRKDVKVVLEIGTAIREQKPDMLTRKMNKSYCTFRKVGN
jgi:hypothetical protein